MGINRAIAQAIKLSITRLGINPRECLVLLDGGLKAPPPFSHQKTIVRGDEKEPVISLASILAKLHRDKKMERFARQYSGYGFDEHKGYGTSQHLKKIRALGMCEIHRRSFLKWFV
jgi:ribonuclease HII